MKLELMPVDGNLTSIQEVWEDLADGHPRSYFLSWSWIENWLASLTAENMPELALVRGSSGPLAGFFLGRRRITRQIVFNSNRLHVNTVGDRTDDDLWIEYNSLLARPEMTGRLRELLELLPEPWDELYLPGLDATVFPGDDLQTVVEPYTVKISQDMPSPYVDLGRICGQNGDYLSLLSKNTRSKIRRSSRLYEEIGPISLKPAADLDSARAIYARLKELHQAAWQDKGESGVFASSYFDQFHSRLIENRFDSGEIQLLEISAGDHTIGCLYSFVYGGVVYFYQSGIQYESDNKLKPGLVAHVEAIKHNAALGHQRYDFLGGSEQYKKSLSTDQNRLVWVVIQKSLNKFKFEDKLKAVRQQLQKKAD